MFLKRRKVFFSTRIRPVLDDWLDLNVCASSGSTVTGAFDNPGISSNFDATATADLGSWFPLYVAVAQQMFEIVAARPDSGVSLDERQSLDPNLPGTLDLFACQQELDSQDTRDAEGSLRQDWAQNFAGETWVRSLGDTRKLFGKAT